MTQYLDVAAAAIVNSHNEVLIAKRAPHRHQGDRWEFPGGKLEPGETAEQALVRELQEELGITATRFRQLITIRHHYGDKAVCLHVFRVESFSGTPHGHEGQPLQWVPVQQLQNYPFPAANVPIIAAVQLPSTLLITPEPDDHPAFLNRIERACGTGIRLLQLRAHRLTDAAYRSLATQVHAITSRYECALLLNRVPDVLAGLPCEGWHLSGASMMHVDTSVLQRRPRWLSAACHDESELLRAQQLGVDFVLVSPVKPTATHPGAAALGWPRFAELAAQANCPVYALGGMSTDDVMFSWQYGGQGIAALRALWPG
ncbi:MAG TPA: Nudix family hydrolase [Permianibacter sp.]|nr:Nudix family hydrolase [Permianibacter sp.]